MIDKIKGKLDWFILGIVFILGLFARLNLINKTTFWYDEAFSGILVKQDLGTILQVIYEDRVHPPVYYLLLKLWSVFFGNTDTTLRMFSVIFGMSLVVVGFLLIRKLINKKAAVAVAGIFALSPYFILYSLEARSYIMLGLEALISIYLFLVIYRKGFKTLKELLKIKETKLLIGVSVLILLTHYVGLALIAVMCLLFFIKLYPKTEKYIWAVLTIILLIIIARGLLNGGDFRIYDKQLTHTKWLEDANLLTPAEMLYSFIFGVDSQQISRQLVFTFSFIKDLSAVFVVITVLAIVLSINMIKKQNKRLSVISKLFLFSLLITTIVCLFGVNLFIPRYVMFLAIVFVVWIASVVSKFNIKTFAIAGLVYLFLLTQVIWVNTNRYFDNIAEIETQAENNRIVVKSPFEYLVLKYYLKNDRNLYFLDSNQWNMKQGPWLFFDRNQITNKLLSTDKVI